MEFGSENGVVSYTDTESETRCGKYSPYPWSTVGQAVSPPVITLHGVIATAWWYCSRALLGCHSSLASIDSSVKAAAVVCHVFNDWFGANGVK